MVLFALVLGVFYFLYRDIPLRPASINGKRSWIEQIIDTRLIIALFQAVVFCGLIFLITSIIGALLDNRLLESFGGTGLAEVREDGIEAVSEMEATARALVDTRASLEAQRRMHQRQINTLRIRLTQNDDLIRRLGSVIEEKDARHKEDKAEIARLRKYRGDGSEKDATYAASRRERSS